MVFNVVPLPVCGLVKTSNPCSPLVSCEAFVNLFVTEVMTGNDKVALCSEWSGFTHGTQDRMAKDFAERAGELGGG